jgi:PAS domain S-box-containing protein
MTEASAFRPPLSTDHAATATADRSADALQTLQDVAQALQENLARGYLESEEQLRQIAEATNDVVLLSDANGGRVLFVNSAYERIWGRSRGELLDNPTAFFDGVHPDDRNRVRDMIMGQSRAEFDIEFRVLRPEGGVRWVWTRGFPVRNTDGVIYRVASITEDVTDRRQIVESHQRLIRGFTHDVKNPLGAADGYLSLLETGVFGDMPPAQAETIVRARRSIHIAIDLVKQLLDIERTESGQMAVERAPVDFCALLHEIAEEFRGAANAKGQHLEVLSACRNGVLVIETDIARVRQILANLISNAVKYTQAGGHITVRPRLASEAEAPWPGRWIAAAVADNGPGIPPEKHGLLFREFTRFDPGAAEGSGIGLAISQRMATALGGAVTFFSEPGAGSTFTLWVPRGEAQETSEIDVSGNESVVSRRK